MSVSLGGNEERHDYDVGRKPVVAMI